MNRSRFIAGRYQGHPSSPKLKALRAGVLHNEIILLIW